MREQVETLKHKTHFQNNPAQLFPLGIATLFSIHQHIPADHNAAPVHPFQVNQAAQQRAFPGTRGADDRHHLPLADLKGDAPQHLVVRVLLVQILCFQHSLPLIKLKILIGPVEQERNHGIDQ